MIHTPYGKPYCRGTGGCLRIWWRKAPPSTHPRIVSEPTGFEFRVYGLGFRVVSSGSDFSFHHFPALVLRAGGLSTQEGFLESGRSFLKSTFENYCRARRIHFWHPLRRLWRGDREVEREMRNTRHSPNTSSLLLSSLELSDTQVYEP